MKRKGYVLFLSLIITMLALAACNSDGKDSVDKGSAGGKGDKDNRILTVAMGSDIVSFDIHDHNNTSTESVHDNMFNYLFKRDENNEIQPELVESFEQLDDLTVQMKLKERV